MELQSTSLIEDIAHLHLQLENLIVKLEILLRKLIFRSETTKSVRRSQTLHRSHKLLDFSLPQPSTMVILTSDNLLSAELSILQSNPQEVQNNIDFMDNQDAQPGNNLNDQFGVQADQQVVQEVQVADNVEFVKQQSYKLKYDKYISISLAHKQNFQKIELHRQKTDVQTQYIHRIMHMPDSQQQSHTFVVRDDQQIISNPVVSNEVILPDVQPFSPPSLEHAQRFSERYQQNIMINFLQLLQLYQERKIQLIQLDDDIDILPE